MPNPTADPPIPTPTTPAAPAPKDPFIRHANLMSGLTILSRISGIVRDKAWSYYLGAGWQFSAFWIGFQFPNLSRRIFGEGALTAAFVPVYTDLLHKHGKDAATKFASSVASLLVIVLTTLTLLGEAIAIPLALSPGISLHNRVAASMVAVMLPYCVMICLVALMGAVATVNEKFTAQSLNPILLNLLTAGGAALAVLFMTRDYPLDKRIFWVAISILIAGICQVAQMLPSLWSSGIHLHPTSWNAALQTAGISALLKTFLPIMLASSAVQINTFMDSQIAWFLSPDGHDGHPAFTLFGHVFNLAMGQGAGAKLSMAQRIYMLPVGIFGVSLAMAVFPAMARASAANNTPELKRLLIAGLRKTLFLSIPSSFGMILVSRPLLTLVYGGGQTTLQDVDRAYWASIFFCVGIWAFEAQMVILRVFFVLKDTKTPTKVSLAMIALNLSLNLTLVWFLQEGGIALSTTIAAITQGAILITILRKRLGRLGARPLLINALKGLIATVIMVEIGYLLSLIPMPWEGGGGALDLRAKLLTSLVKLPLLIAACGTVYLALARFLQIPELLDMPLIGKYFKPYPLPPKP